MTQSDATRRDLVAANHILAREGVLDAFGHVSLRDPTDAGRYLLSRSRSPEIVAEADIRRFTLDSRPDDPESGPFYAERVIHGALFQLRPDIGAVCHFHAPAIMPFCVTGTAIVPVSHVGATMGETVPFWSGRDAFGDTNMLVSTAEEGASLAAAMGPHWAVLMANHGAVVAGRTLREMLFRAIHFCRDAEILQAALRLGTVTPLTPGEIRLASEINLRDTVLQRAWDYWLHRASRGRSGRPDMAAE
jgi:HCOMODA/2-hydroxy-3-carboxy-muconic semialdehyde decarboxylase